MAQKEDEPLNQGDLDQDVASADADEVEKELQEFLVPRQARAEQQGRERQNHNRGHQADRHQAQHDRDRHVDLEIGSGGGRLVAAHEVPQETPDVARLHGVEEERPVIADGAYVERIALLEGPRVPGAHQRH